MIANLLPKVSRKPWTIPTNVKNAVFRTGGSCMYFPPEVRVYTSANTFAVQRSYIFPKRWVRQFDEFPLDVVGPAVFDMVLKGFVSSKNLKRLKKIGESIKTLQPTSHSMTSSSQDLNED